MMSLHVITLTKKESQDMQVFTFEWSFYMSVANLYLYNNTGMNNKYVHMYNSQHVCM